MRSSASLRRTQLETALQTHSSISFCPFVFRDLGWGKNAYTVLGDLTFLAKACGDEQGHQD